MTAAYAEPCVVFSLRTRPAFVHGWSPSAEEPRSGSRTTALSEVTRAVIVPSPSSDRCTK
jgi:hypothetical protein